MIATWYESSGLAEDVIKYGEFPDPFPGPGQVGVRMAFSACNFHDVKKRKDGRELKTYPKVVPNCDGSGVIESVGEGISADRIGERVWLFGSQIGQAWGTGAEFCVVPSWKAISLPTSAKFEDGACLGIPAVTAYHSIFSNGPIDGKTIFISGANGRVARYAVQLAKYFGANVICTTGKPENKSILLALGADQVFCYSDGDLEEQIKGLGLPVSNFISSGLQRDLGLACKVLRSDGQLTAFGFDDNPNPSISCARLSSKNLTIRLVGIFAMRKDTHLSAFSEINNLLSENKLSHNIGNILTLTEMAKAHSLVENLPGSGATLVRC